LIARSGTLLAIVFAALVASVLAASAVEPDEMLKDPNLEARARAITRELRCVVCQNQSIDDSDAPLAHDMRVLVRARISQGDSDDAVRRYLVARYGNFVLLKPPLQADTLALWLSPFLFLAVAFALMWSYFRAMSRDVPPPQPLSEGDELAFKRLSEEG
jgi:cytochrome c-type biogenesis protein CcmH